MILVEIGLFILAFLIGGIPTGYIIVKVFKKRDIREYGSGNIGFSNVLRTEGIIPGVCVLIIDAGKAFATTYFLSFQYSNIELLRVLLGVSVILGNIFTPFLGFKGGKGVGTALGVAISVNPAGAILSLCGFVPVVIFTRYMSVGSLTAVTIYIISSIVMYKLTHLSVYGTLFAAILFFLVVLRHVSNIKRLIRGEENKIGIGKKWWRKASTQ